MSRTVLNNHELVVGYVFEHSQAELRSSRQAEQINEFCRKKSFNLIFTEKEAGLPKDICRPLFWQATCALFCYRCPAPDLPIAYDVAAWINRAMSICRCNQSSGVSGMVVTAMSSICTDPVSGSQYALALAVAGKHLYVVAQGKCVSCCNPAARAFM